MQRRNAIIYLFSFAGSGKLTIAQEIQKIVPSILVDNHFINNVVFALIDPDGVSPLPDQVWKNVRRVRHIVLDTIRDLSQPDRNFIFTNELIHGSAADQEVYDRIASLAAQRGAFFFPVRLLISPEELCLRTVFPERITKFKSTDADAARRQAIEHEVFRPSQPCFELEISDLSAEESAQEIVAALEQKNVD